MAIHDGLSIIFKFRPRFCNNSEVLSQNKIFSLLGRRIVDKDLSLCLAITTLLGPPDLADAALAGDTTDIIIPYKCFKKSYHLTVFSARNSKPCTQSLDLWIPPNPLRSPYLTTRGRSLSSKSCVSVLLPSPHLLFPKKLKEG